MGRKALEALMHCFDISRLDDAVVLTFVPSGPLKTETFEALLKLGTIEAVLGLGKSLKKLKGDVQAVLETRVAQKAGTYMEAVDYTDYPKLDVVMTLVNQLALMPPGNESLLLC